jgi:LuxR family transcriptional regulator, maltose regulon positive regulatory protein
MKIPILTTKLFIPPLRSNLVARPRLIKRLHAGMHRKLTVISASAGFGKTTLVSEWLHNCNCPVAWLSLDDGDNDPARFLTYLFAALQTIAKNMEEGVFALLHSPQLPPLESFLTALINEITSIPEAFVLVLDDYHVIRDERINQTIAYLLEHLPPQMHLVIITREEPRLPLARLRVRDQLTHLRAADLRFTYAEATEFLRRVMGLPLSADDITLLESRTEGWVAGLQLAALSIKEQVDATSFIQSFTGSNPFVLDYLVEEVLKQQSTEIQTFLLHTSILDRMSGPLCDALLGSFTLSATGQETLEYLERANLFIIPLDHERRWYRYHHLFADLLRQRLRQSVTTREGNRSVAELHILASIWFEANALMLEAFHHAACAQDVQRAARLAEGEGMPLLFRGAVASVSNWLNSLSKDDLDASPSLWVMVASARLMTGQITDVERHLHAAEKALRGVEQDEKTRDVIGHIAAIRATLAVSKHQVDTIIAEARRALEYLHPDNLPVRTATAWSLGYAYQLQGDRAKANKAYTEALSNSQRIGHVMITILASLGLGKIQEEETQLHVAAETYQRVLKWAGDPALPVACEAHLGLARIFYEWNDLDSALHHGQQAVQLGKLLEQTDRAVAGEVMLARLRLAQGDVRSAMATIAKADLFARQHNFMHQLPHIAETQILTLLHQGNLDGAAVLAQKHLLPLSMARVHLAQGNPAEALAVLQPLDEQSQQKERVNERLKVKILLAIALHRNGEKAEAMQNLRDALTMAQPGGFIRIFVDEGTPMKRLFHEAATHGIMHNDIAMLLAAFETDPPFPYSAQSLIEPLSERELEILHLIAQGLSNREIGERLFLALSTVKGHNQNIFAKLQVKRRTEAVAYARELGLL